MVSGSGGESIYTYDEESDDFVTTYSWNGKNVSEKTFFASWDAVMDRDKVISFYDISKSADDILMELD